jgi:hypothetical protein
LSREAELWLPIVDRRRDYGCEVCVSV